MNTPANESALHRRVLFTALIALLGAAAAACDPRHGDPGATEHTLLPSSASPLAAVAADAPPAAPPATIAEEYATEQAALPATIEDEPPPSY